MLFSCICLSGSVRSKFNPPVAHAGWGSDVYDASDGLSYKLRDKQCLQITLTQKGTRGSEDCLYLNVWVSGGVEEARKNPLPVMVWIHGGAYAMGSGWGANFLDNWLYDQEPLTLHGNVVSVSLNYRLGPLGFLSTGDSAAPGNYGLLDQVEALRWVKNNIWAFGGDTSRITIFGESAGSASVSFHMLSPLSKDLFHRGISQSGTAFSSWAVVKEPLRWAKQVAEGLNCPTDTSTTEMMTCIRSAPIDDIVTSVGIISRNRDINMDLPWSAVIDGYFLPDRPENLQINSADKDYLLGNNNMDGHLFVGIDFPQMNIDHEPMYHSDLVKASTRFTAGIPKQVSDAVVYQYQAYSDTVDDTFYKKAVLDVYTDSLFAAGTQLTAQYHAAMPQTTGSTYVYMFSHPSKMPFLYPPWMGADHADDLQYVYDKPHKTPLVYTSDERSMSEALMTYWTNFAWSGDPNTGPNVGPAFWKAYDLQTKNYLEINGSLAANGDSALNSNYRADYVAFWGIMTPQLWESSLGTCRVTDTSKQSRASVAPACPKDADFQRETLSGCVQGESQYWNGIMYSKFLGVPYASPPVGNKRFSNPTDPQTWFDVRPATQFGKICPQYPFDSSTMDEDCLFLNVYVPVDTTISIDNVTPNKYPVMIWLHGGSYVTGDAGQQFEAGVISARSKVIVVTLNYRLGSLGLFTTGDAHAPGNFALFDQNLALRWVKDNIASFSGDPTRVTIFGQGAGAESAHMHTLSPTSSPLGFNQVILESGCATTLNEYPDQVQTSKTFGTNAGCDASASDSLVACLRGKTVQELVTAQNNLQFAPVVDNYFLPDDPQNLMDSATLSQWSYLMGVNAADGTTDWETVTSAQNADDLHQVVENKFAATYGLGTSDIDVTYTMWSDPQFNTNQQEVQEEVLQMFTDQHYVAPLSQLADAASNSGSSVHFYQFSRVASFSDAQKSYPEWVGAIHGAEVPYVWGDVVRSFSSEGQYPDDASLTYSVITYWTNFAKTGDPNSDEYGSSTSQSWPLYDANNKRYLDLDSPIQSSSYLRGKQVYFWNDLLPTLEVTCPAIGI
uniref:Bile salt-activated lipase n=1 Tax=Phallusia mammillata TaxID=59560 RepID=A0A6F9DMJ0_9ASCI|nr:neuroligin-4, X-linked [Phallusia mammillata]